MNHEVLLVDDAEDVRFAIGGVLSDAGYLVREAHSAEEAIAKISERKPSLVLADIWLADGGMDGLQLLSYLRELDPHLPIILISGHGNIETAVNAIRKGAYDFLEKPFQSDRLLLVVQRALETTRLKRENETLRNTSPTSTQLIGKSQSTAQLRALIDRIAPGNSRILISGPPGSGKELCARLIHARSQRGLGPFVAVNAASISPERMESELFGEEGPDGRIIKLGLLEQAHGGSLLLDEVADMPKGTQSKILRVLIDQRFRRVNGAADVRVDVRMISSTSRNMRLEIEGGRFREDLYYRLNVVPLAVPSLAERRDDVPLLVEFFLSRLAASSGLVPRSFSMDAMAVLQAADWPGNIRQLRNVVERVLILASGDPGQPVRAEDMPADVIGSGAHRLVSASFDLIGLPLRDAREQFEREYLSMQITRFGGNVSRTASFIGMERSALHRKLKALSVPTDGTSDPSDES
jgi:two-component system nitrogen regulation response regulator NtrX